MWIQDEQNYHRRNGAYKPQELLMLEPEGRFGEQHKAQGRRY